jgi:hypothetical protein
MPGHWIAGTESGETRVHLVSPRTTCHDCSEMKHTDRPEGPADRSPRVTRLAWGQMVVEGLGAGKDFKLYPGGGRAWDWHETGTQHSPGIQPADVHELLNHRCTVVVLSRGMELRLQTMPETLTLLHRHGVRVHVEETAAAVELYNQLTATEPVGGLFHSTC